LFATTLPGLGKLLAREIADQPGLDPAVDVGFDGRADVVFFDVTRGGDRGMVNALRLAEDVFVTVATARSASPRQVARTLISRPAIERALSTWSRLGRRLHSAMTFRTVARVVDEARFKRTELRDAVTREIAANRPRWRLADPAALEVWVLEHRQGRFVSGLRLSDKRMRQRGEGRTVERRGALRPVVAAAMVRAAGRRPGRLLDPCCGTGTILREAQDLGWRPQGSDIDPEAVDIARTNVPGAAIQHADVHRLPHPDGTFDAVVSNLPFGRQFRVDVEPKRWVRDTLREAARVTRPGGRVVVLLPPPTPLDPPGLSLAEDHPVRLLGVSTRIWVYDRLPVDADTEHLQRAPTTTRWSAG
jgi:23S rRNA G2445 N2-methylase RlmL